ncbi:S8 family serine peptidase [Candidatus Binatus soli]|uniref:S8 family serine peptidase n=1 Tax=Candidatus Binatus soli TaxID=1953413 RepID=UPI003D099EEC
MPKGQDAPAPRTFFLNEQHELAHGESAGGGALPKLASVDWGAKGRRINKSLSEARHAVEASRDPLKRRRYFLLAKPVEAVAKLSQNKTKAPDGTYSELTHYGGEHSLVFRRLGLDLISVHDNGSATVHAPTDRMERLLATTRSLADEGLREQARWATIDAFSTIPPGLRVDEIWLKSLSPALPTDVVVEFQPMLTRTEIEDVMRALASVLSQANREAFTGSGNDFSGRHWLRGQVARRSLQSMASDFFSVQSLHPPLSTPIAVSSGPRSRTRGQTVQKKSGGQVDSKRMPCVAVVDTGVPTAHKILTPYRRPGGYQSPNSPSPHLGDHGSFVASRVVFGDVDCSDGNFPDDQGNCGFLDVMVAESVDRIFDKDILPALEAVIATSPDVRVFNLSLGDFTPLQSFNDVERREKLLLLQDLDNFVFARDVLVVVAAGNTRPGLIPSVPYPNNYQDPNWALGSWATGFNTLTCGSTVERLSPDGLVKEVGWPSPFTRVGPGICDAPIPGFSAHGGNTTESYQAKPFLGVWGCTADALWEDRCGTSHAAPLVAREAAFALQELQNFCPSGARPFAATAKAFLALTAVKRSYPPQVKQLVERTLGRGTPNAARLQRPTTQTAVMIWQGVLNNVGDIARVQVPIPREWLKTATAPRLRVLCAWDSPVHEAVHDLWACRQVTIHLKPTAASKAIRGSQSHHRSYPMIDRTYDLDLKRFTERGISFDSDTAILELSYSQTADYHPAISFSPQQKIGLSLELFDEFESPSSPQAYVQALPMAKTMTRLSIQSVPLATPVLIRQ